MDISQQPLRAVQNFRMYAYRMIHYYKYHYNPVSGQQMVISPSN